MTTPWRLRGDVRAIPVDAERVIIVGAERCHLLTGRIYGPVLAALDGARDLEGLIAVVPRPAPEVMLGLHRLWQGDLLEAPDVDWGPVPVRQRGGLVLTPDPLHPALERFHRGGAPWTLLCVQGVQAWRTPTLGTPSGPCWRCLTRAHEHNRPVRRWLEARGGVEAAPPVAHPAVLAAALADPESVPVVPLRRRPDCPDCGGAPAPTIRVELVPRPRHASEDGGHRIVSPEATWARLCHHVDPRVGLVASLGPIGDDPLRPVFGAVHRRCPAPDQPIDADAFHLASTGKGRTAAQARVSALCEALERACGAWRGTEPSLRAPLAAVADRAIPPPRLLGFSDRQYAERPSWGEGVRGQAVPAPFDPAVPLAWTPAWSITHDEERLLPLSWSYYGTPVTGPRVCAADSNGTAAGNCMEEAVLQGLLELIERDAVAIWWAHRLPCPAVDPSDDLWIAALLADFDRRGWTVRLLALPSDLGVPVFAAVAHHRQTGRPCVGFGCHLDAPIAAERAFAELNQLFVTKPDDPPWDPAISGPWLRPTRIVGSLGAQPRLGTGDLKADVEACVARLAAADLEVIVLDQRRPEVELAVARVVVPGLRHVWPRYGPGRLYTVPVALGLLPRLPTEADLNSAPLLL